MPDFPTFREKLMEDLKDPHEAAYYLAACLEDAIEEEDHAHFFHAVSDVSKAIGGDIRQSLRLLRSHIAPADFPNVDENMSILMAKLMQQAEASRDHLQEA